MSADSIVIKSVRDGSTLVFTDFAPEYAGADSKSFVVTASTRGWAVEQRVSAYMATDLGKFFRELATNWRGWKGARTWSTLEGELELAASSDNVGHIKLAFILSQGFSGGNWRLHGELELEAGALESLAEEAQHVWRANAA